jgi:tetratricopeptide (TPR) repeat protein
MSGHLDDFALLRYTAGDLTEGERSAALAHLADCGACADVLEEVRNLDAELRTLAAAGEFDLDESSTFAISDPFRRRPRRGRPRRSVPGVPDLVSLATSASEAAAPLQRRIIDTVAIPQHLEELVSSLPLSEPEHRFALLYALQEAGRGIAEDPTSASEFARIALEEITRSETPPAVGEWMVPTIALKAQALILAAQACIWTKDFTHARSHLAAAYRAFARLGDETGLSVVELNESQRRALAGEGHAALVLARRARTTFAARGMEDQAARTFVAEGLACFALGRLEESIRAYREALPVFARYELWTNYVGTLNSIATSLQKLGRLDEARREYARALRRFSNKEHRSWLGFLRAGLAEILFSAAHYREAAISFSQAARLFAESGLQAYALTAMLQEVESWARYGSLGRARQRLEGFWLEVRSVRQLDPSVERGLGEALSGTNPDFERLAALREQVTAALAAARPR